MANRLETQTSPYLLQHAENPVDWWPWGDEAFAEARRRDVPVFISVGYSSCHWCHVMAHESFEDAELAAYLNERFVSVKVDREERPDVDTVYMQATQELAGHGGWPMSVWVDHEGRPFYAGTYYPPAPRQGMPSFRQILEAIDDAWTTRRTDVESSAASITSGLQRRIDMVTEPTPVTEALLADAVDSLVRQFDTVNGGFGRAPKFPPSAVLRFLGREAARADSDAALAMLAGTCEPMARGGIYDQLGGGFARYSVDSEWVVPHFEKMLYDNAQLIGVYTDWWRLTHAPLAERIVSESIEFLLRELQTEHGAFAAALDADTDGAEGAFYVWSPAQLREALGTDDGDWVADLCSVTNDGSFEHGLSVLQLRRDPDDVERWVRLRQHLLLTRNQRNRPGRDDKVVLAWNGLAIEALAIAGRVFDRPDWVVAATECAEFVTTVHLDKRVDGSVALYRTSRDGVAGSALGVLEDYGDLAAGLLALYSATGEARWFDRADRIIAAATEHFAADDGGYFDTADDAPALVQRPRDPADNAYPSGQSALAGALLTHYALTGSAQARGAATAALANAGALLTQAPRFAGWSLAVASALVDGPREVAIVGEPGAPDTLSLLTAFFRTPSAGATLAFGAPGEATPIVPLLIDRGLVRGQAAAYVCRDQVCHLPVTEPDALAAQLRE